MEILPIKLYGEEVLRRQSETIDNIDGALVDLLRSTIITMKTGKGIGLAANQVGINKRFYAVDLSYFDVVKNPVVIINPEIVEISDNIAVGEEGCLSFPKLFFELERPEEVTVKGLDINGEELVLEGRGLLARVLLHELDHLNGRLFIDYLSKAERDLLKGKLRNIKEHGKA